MKPRDLKERLNGVGWFIPPYVSSDFLAWLRRALPRHRATLHKTI